MEADEVLEPEALGLDERAADFVRKLPEERQREILDKLQADQSSDSPTIQNPSAFATRMAKEILASEPPLHQEGSSRKLTPEEFGLDDKATDFLNQLPPRQVQDVLERLQNDFSNVRSPSAFVTRLVKEAQANMSQAGRDAGWQGGGWSGPGGGWGPAPDQERRPPGRAMPPPSGPGSRHMPIGGTLREDMAISAAGGSPRVLNPEQFDLDDNAIDFLQKVPPEVTQEILEKLQADWSSIRSPSAFVTRLANEALQGSSAPGPAIGSFGGFAPPMGRSSSRPSGHSGSGFSGSAQATEELTPQQFDLDQNAEDFLWKLQPQQRHEILEKLQAELGSIRSPSAFVTKLCRDMQQRGEMGPSAPSAVSSRGGYSVNVDNFGPRLLRPEEFPLDGPAVDFLWKLPAHKMQEVLQTLQADQHSIRSPSAFVTQLAKEHFAAHGGGPDGNQVSGRMGGCGMGCWGPSGCGGCGGCGCMGGCGGCMGGCGGCYGLGGFCGGCGGCYGGGCCGYGAMGSAAMPSAGWPSWGSSGQSNKASASASAPRSSASGGGAAQDGRLTPEQFGLDANATDFIRQLPPAKMQDVLRRLEADWGSVRSPSAFVTRLVKDMLEDGAGGPPPSRRGEPEEPLTPEQFRLDSQATDYVQKLPPHQMQEVLQRLQAEWRSVRSPSAFVTRLVKETLAGGGVAGYGAAKSTHRQGGSSGPYGS